MFPYPFKMLVGFWITHKLYNYLYLPRNFNVKRMTNDY